MKVTPIEHGLDYYGKSSGPRSTERLHMSQIYGSLFQDMYPDRFVKDRPMNPGHLELGLAWENMLEDGIKERLRQGQGADRPGEFVTEEGIVFSPDLLLFNGVTRLGEIKLTWVSSKEMPRTAGESFPSHPTVQKWLCQMMAYAYHLDTPYARLYAFHVNGEYAWMRKGGNKDTPGGPQLFAYDIEFSKRELHDNWQMLLGHAKSSGLLTQYGL